MPAQDRSVFTEALRRAGPGYGVHPPLVRHNLGDTDGYGLYQPGLGADPTAPPAGGDPVSNIMGLIAGIPKLVLYTAAGWVIYKYVLKK